MRKNLKSVLIAASVAVSMFVVVEDGCGMNLADASSQSKTEPRKQSSSLKQTEQDMANDLYKLVLCYGPINQENWCALLEILKNTKEKYTNDVMGRVNDFAEFQQLKQNLNCTGIDLDNDSCASQKLKELVCTPYDEESTKKFEEIKLGLAKKTVVDQLIYAYRNLNESKFESFFDLYMSHYGYDSTLPDSANLLNTLLHFYGYGIDPEFFRCYRAWDTLKVLTDKHYKETLDKSILRLLLILINLQSGS